MSNQYKLGIMFIYEKTRPKREPVCKSNTSYGDVEVNELLSFNIELDGGP